LNKGNTVYQIIAYGLKRKILQKFFKCFREGMILWKKKR
jgi:hypothetical protein